MADYQGVLADLRGKLAALDVERAALQSAITAISALAPVAAPLFPANRFKGKSLREAALAYLAERPGSPERTPEVVEGLRAAGVKSDAKTFANQVYNVMYVMSKRDHPEVFRDGDAWVYRKR